MKAAIALWAIGGLMMLLAGCAQSSRALPPVTAFDLSRYTGTWYEIVRYPHRFERGLTGVMAEYTLRPNGTIAVENRGFDPQRGQWRAAHGTARVAGAPDAGLLKVSFFGPFYAPYKIIRLDTTNYSHAVVTSSSMKYFWILARTPALPENTLRELLEYAEASGFETARMTRVDQSLNINRFSLGVPVGSQ